MTPQKTKIWSTGSYLPKHIVKNEELTQFSPAMLPLIREKTGVLERRYADAAECTSDLAVQAARVALARAACGPLEIDCIILATSTPDRPQPATATRVQHKLGAKNAFAFDVNSVCSGGVYALGIADSFIRSGFCSNVLVVAAEVYSRILNPRDFATAPYFGDGAGAVLLSCAKGSGELLHTLLKTDGSGSELIQVAAGGSMKPISVARDVDACFKMKGKEVFEFAVTKGTEVVNNLLANAGVGLEEVRCIITHQANINIIRELSARLGISIERFYVNLEKYGNTAAASTLIAMDEAITIGRIQSGEYLVVVAFGGGLSWGATLIKL